MLTSKHTDERSFPDGSGTVTIRKLSHYQLMMSEDATIDDALDKMRRVGDVKLPEADADTKARREAEAQKPENKYNRAKILEYGIVAWSYGEPLDEEHRRDLDEPSAAWLFDEILAFSIRAADEVKASANASPL